VAKALPEMEITRIMADCPRWGGLAPPAPYGLQQCYSAEEGLCLSLSLSTRFPSLYFSSTSFHRPYISDDPFGYRTKHSEQSNLFLTSSQRVEFSQDRSSACHRPKVVTTLSTSRQAFSSGTCESSIYRLAPKYPPSRRRQFAIDPSLDVFVRSRDGQDCTIALSTTNISRTLSNLGFYPAHSFYHLQHIFDASPSIPS
jgi:hypothetical protein